MRKHVYISADYDYSAGDRNVVNELHKWRNDALHKVDFIDMAEVSSGTVANDNDCRICDLKAEFNKQINASSAVIFIIGDKTCSRMAGNRCERAFKKQGECFCTPYKQNVNGSRECKVSHVSIPGKDDDFGNINNYSYLRHEFEQAKKKGKQIIIIYNSTRKESSWLPSYMASYENNTRPFWIIDRNGNKVGDYSYIKEVLGF